MDNDKERFMNNERIAGELVKIAKSLVGRSGATFTAKESGDDILLSVTVGADDTNARSIYANLMDAEKEAAARCRKAAGGEDWAKLQTNWTSGRGGLTQVWKYEFGAEDPDDAKQIKRTLERG